jgi:hypothetical protein
MYPLLNPKSLLVIWSIRKFELNFPLMRVIKTRQKPGFVFGGGGEIRTLDRLLTYAGFQDRCIQPLCHPSGK